MDSVIESSFNLKRFETKWEALLENYIGYDVRQKTFGNEKKIKCTRYDRYASLIYVFRSAAYDTYISCVF